MTRFRFPEPDPNMTPLPADFRERVMKELQSRARKRAWRRAGKAAAALLIVTAALYLGTRAFAPAPPVPREIVKQTPARETAPPFREEAVPKNEVTSTVPHTEMVHEPAWDASSGPEIFVLHAT